MGVGMSMTAIQMILPLGDSGMSFCSWSKLIRQSIWCMEFMKRFLRTFWIGCRYGSSSRAAATCRLCSLETRLSCVVFGSHGHVKHLGSLAELELMDKGVGGPRPTGTHWNSFYSGSCFTVCSTSGHTCWTTRAPSARRKSFPPRGRLLSGSMGTHTLYSSYTFEVKNRTCLASI